MKKTKDIKKMSLKKKILIGVAIIFGLIILVCIVASSSTPSTANQDNADKAVASSTSTAASTTNQTQPTAQVQETATADTTTSTDDSSSASTTSKQENNNSISSNNDTQQTEKDNEQATVPVKHATTTENHSKQVNVGNDDVFTGVIRDIGGGKEAHLHSSPDSSSPTLDILQPGTHVKYLGTVGKWNKIELKNGDIGYVYYHYI